jgi:hypothetical protein
LVAKAISGFVLVGGIAWIVFYSHRNVCEGENVHLQTVRQIYWILGLLLLTGPAVFPWYVGWIVPFLCFFPNRAWLYLTLASQVYYLRFWTIPVDYFRFEDLPFFGFDSSWELARPLEYIPFYALLLYGGLRNR